MAIIFTPSSVEDPVAILKDLLKSSSYWLDYQIEAGTKYLDSEKNEYNKEENCLNNKRKESWEKYI